MLAYSHFALRNLYLVNGYHEVETPNGTEREYEREDELEQCVRRILVRKPESLRGWDLRFLRRGLDLSQAEFGEMIDRDAQTVARWEKSSEILPKFVDQTIRTRFAARFEPSMGIDELLSYVDGIARKLPEKILLTLTNAGWTFDFEPRIKFVVARAQKDLSVSLPGSYGLLAQVHVAERYDSATGVYNPFDESRRSGENSSYKISAPMLSPTSGFMTTKNIGPTRLFHKGTSDADTKSVH